MKTVAIGHDCESTSGSRCGAKRHDQDFPASRTTGMSRESEKYELHERYHSIASDLSRAINELSQDSGFAKPESHVLQERTLHGVSRGLTQKVTTPKVAGNNVHEDTPVTWAPRAHSTAYQVRGRGQGPLASCQRESRTSRDVSPTL